MLAERRAADGSTLVDAWPSLEGWRVEELFEDMVRERRRKYRRPQNTHLKSFYYVPCGLLSCLSEVFVCPAITAFSVEKQSSWSKRRREWNCACRLDAHFAQPSPDRVASTTLAPLFFCPSITRFSSRRDFCTFRVYQCASFNRFLTFFNFLHLIAVATALARGIFGYLNISISA